MVPVALDFQGHLGFLVFQEYQLPRAFLAHLHGSTVQVQILPEEFRLEVEELLYERCLSDKLDNNFLELKKTLDIVINKGNTFRKKSPSGM